MRYRFYLHCALVVLSAVLLAACAGRGGRTNTDAGPTGPRVQVADLNSPARPVLSDGPLSIGTAKNEWASFTLQLSQLPQGWEKRVYSLRIRPPKLAGGNAKTPTTIGIGNFSFYQVVSMPVDADRAAYVRHTGLPTSVRKLPRALLPMQADDGLVNLAARPSKADPGEPPLLWVDLHVPPETPAGEYETTCELYEGGSKSALASLPLKISIYNFVLPDDRHLLMVSQLPWGRLSALYPREFEATSPRLMNRDDPRHHDAVRVLDQLVVMAQQHRTQIVVPRLQPTVKWPAGKPPLVDWRDFDTVVRPWLRGDLFADHVPLGYWPLPAIDYLDRFDPDSRSQYWAAAASHFDQMDWLGRSAIFMERSATTAGSAAETLQICAEAAQLLTVHPQVRVAVPIQPDQVQLASESNPKMVDPRSAARLLAAAPSLVSAPSQQPWPSEVPPPQKWLRTDLPGLVPYIGAGGDERDVRQWAWLAFLRQAELILWSSALPETSGPAELADPNELVWFYPGSWFGLNEPVATVQLKWLRRAQQDYEYLWLARQRGEVLNALLMARLITKPVEIQPGQAPDPVYALMSGTVDPKAWADVQRLLARTVLLREPGQQAEPAKQNELNLQTLQWIEPQERPLLLPRTTQWQMEEDPNVAGGHWVQLRLGLEVYNASDNTPDQNQIQWDTLPAGWRVRPQPMQTPPLQVYQVHRYLVHGSFDLDHLTAQARQPLNLTFTNGFTRRSYSARLSAPIATCDRRLARLQLDGSLDDWNQADALQDGPLVRMIDRPGLQRQQMQLAPTPTSLYSAWADENLYLAFKVNGTSPPSAATSRNFVSYQSRRIWGEDLAELLIQPMYADNSVGPVLHVVCKPGGAQWVERKLDPRTNVDPWQPVEGAAVRYAATLDQNTWRGEIAIPWRLINTDSSKGPPVLLRFNFVEHHAETGQSASWAGPIDFGRDESFTGLLYLRESKAIGMGTSE